ncbi:MAG: apolipoprotein N-acyltransferase [Armatimonadota bacterium]|nr:apolipoprotein N-acyltransferase [Armatimonadota bacterium]
MPRSGGIASPGRPWSVVGALTTGALLAAVFPRWDQGWLAWVSLVPLLLVVRHAGPGTAFWLGCLSGLVAYGGLMEWIRLFGTPAWLALTVIMSMFLGMFAAAAAALAARYQARRSGAWLWVIPLTWAAVEYARSTGPLGFPWGLLGLTQYRSPVVLSLAPLVGTGGIGAVIALVNAAIAEVIASPRRRAAPVALLGVLAALAGAHRLAVPPASSSRVVGAIQPNVPPETKGMPETSAAILEGLLRQTREARRAGAQIIVFPETALPADAATSPAARLAVARAAGGAVVVAGAFLPGPLNGVLVIGQDGATLGRYAKRRLVPFGEAGVRPGRDAGPVQTPEGAIALAICYESAFSPLIRPQVADGAALIAVLTNDGWFGTSAGPAQHAAHAVLRAAETGRSVVRAANTGTSMLIRPDGGVTAVQPLGTAGVLVGALPTGGPVSFYVRWGWMLPPLAAAAWLIASLPLAWQAVRRRLADSVRLLISVLAPAAVLAADRLLAGRDDGPGVVASCAVLALCAALARRDLLDWRRMGASVMLSVGLTVVLLAAMRGAYARYGFVVPLGPSGGGWLPWLAPHLLKGFAVEAWLRGATFSPAMRLGGWPLAIAVSTVLGVFLHAGQSQEIVFWHLVTGAGFGAIRLWTRDAMGLGPARGVGDAVVMGLAGLR